MYALRYRTWWLTLMLSACASSWAVGACLTGRILPEGWRQDAHAGQVLIKGGAFVLGSAQGYADERPATPSHVASFWMDRTEVTNAQFASFVSATGYVTQAEQQGVAAVFVVPTSAELSRRPLAWWRAVKGASWRHPTGPGSGIRGKASFPVVLVTRKDALAFAHWLGRDLPTEAEWEYAAKAGRQGDALDAAPRDAAGKPSANYWQGPFPLLNVAEDGYPGIAPVGCYAPNAFGLYDTIGNVWEWTQDDYRGPHQDHANGDPALLRGASSNNSAIATQQAVIKGGSFLCAQDYCVRYRASARTSQEPDLATSHVGFRTVSRR